MRPLVYLADLRHDFGGVLSIDTMPLSIGYMKAVLARDLREVESRVFVFPGRLLFAMQENPPDILMVSNYVWNEALSLHFVRLGKRLNPRMLTVMGGPNISCEAERRLSCVESLPDLDLYVVGEGDFVARDLVRDYLAAGTDLDGFRAKEHASSIWRRPDGTMGYHPEPDRRDGIAEIPSPWLTGVMDEFFDGKLAPMIETNRGCPFACSFCVQGTSYYNKIANFDLERLHDELRYIARRIREWSPEQGMLRIADANYGMFDRDVKISEYIGEVQRDFGWPTFIDATTGKNRAQKIIESMEKVNGALVLYQAVQSLDENVLRNVRRSNIRLEAYEQIGIHVRGRGLRMNSDLILGLPGETLATHRGAMRKLINAGTDQMHCFQAMMLKGSDMERLQSRETFRFGTRFRVLPKNYGQYDGERVFDIEEIVVETDTLPFDDYLRARELHLAFSVFWNDGWFRDLIEFARTFGVERFEWLDAMREAMRSHEDPIRSFLDQFLDETRGELFPSREACAAFYRQDADFERLRRGEIGDNLMYKYRAIASFLRWPEVCACAMNATQRMAVERGWARNVPEFDVFWSAFHAYVRSRHAHGSTAEQVLSTDRVSLAYDFPAWLAAGTPVDVRPFRLTPPRSFEFRLSDEGAHELAKAFQVWSHKIQGLAKLVTRIRVASQVRECVPMSGGA